jgi:hypothetical protein
MLQCNEMASGASSETITEQLPCCQKVPVPPSSSANTYSAVISTDGHVQISTVAYPPSHAPLWALLIASPKFEDVANIKSTFPPENFSPPSDVYAVSQLASRAPPSLI